MKTERSNCENCNTCEEYDDCVQRGGAVWWALFISILALLFGFFNYLNAQTFEFKLENAIQTSANSFEFDVNVSAPNEILFTAFQCALTYNKNIGENISFHYLTNTSELSNTPLLNSVKRYDDNGVAKLAFGTAQGYDLIKNKVRVGRFVVRNSTAFNVELPEIKWSFTGNVNTIIAGEYFKDITSKGSFSNLIYNLPLPVELISFSAEQKEKTVVINFATATETNSYGFEVYRDTTKLCFLAGAGNSNSPKYYSFVDTTVKNGVHVYSIKQIDSDGSFQFSNAIAVNYFVEEETPKKIVDVPTLIALIMIISIAIFSIVIALNKKKQKK